MHLHRAGAQAQVAGDFAAHLAAGRPVRGDQELDCPGPAPGVGQRGRRAPLDLRPLQGQAELSRHGQRLLELGLRHGRVTLQHCHLAQRAGQRRHGLAARPSRDAGQRRRARVDELGGAVLGSEGRNPPEDRHRVMPLAVGALPAQHDCPAPLQRGPRPAVQRLQAGQGGARIELERRLLSSFLALCGTAQTLPRNCCQNQPPPRKANRTRGGAT